MTHSTSVSNSTLTLYGGHPPVVLQYLVMKLYMGKDCSREWDNLLKYPLDTSSGTLHRILVNEGVLIEVLISHTKYKVTLIA